MRIFQACKPGYPDMVAVMREALCYHGTLLAGAHGDAASSSARLPAPAPR